MLWCAYFSLHDRYNPMHNETFRILYYNTLSVTPSERKLASNKNFVLHNLKLKKEDYSCFQIKILIFDNIIMYIF